MRRVIVIVAIVAAVGLAASPGVKRFIRRLAAQRQYEHAFAAYMMSDVDEAEKTFSEIASKYADLPIGVMAKLKVAFLAYDERKDLDRAEALFTQVLDEHPDGVLYLSDSPVPDYEGELELVAHYFLGLIARERGDAAGARAWLEKVANQGSCNPANLIVAATSDLLRGMDADARKGETSP